MEQTPAAREPLFVEMEVRERFYQSSAFFPLPVVLISTRCPDGSINLAPYSLLFPDPDPTRPVLHLCCRTTSNTAANLRAGSGATICFIPDEAVYLENLRQLGRPGDSAEKMKGSIFHLLPSDGETADGQPMPDRVAEALQVFECRLADDTQPAPAGSDTCHVSLRVERILLRPAWRTALENGTRVPSLPVDYGFRDPTASWLSRPDVRAVRPRLRPRFEFDVPLPRDVVQARFEARANDPSTGLVASFRGNHFTFDFPDEQRRFGTPQLEVQVFESPAESEAGTQVRARVGPHPHIWTLFAFIHALVAFGGLIGLMGGFSQWAAGESPWLLAAVPAALFLHAFVAGAAFVGQGLTADQVYRLRTFVEDTLARPREPVPAAATPPEARTPDP